MAGGGVALIGITLVQMCIRDSQQSDEVHPAAYPKPQRLDYRAGRKTERAACTNSGGGSDTSSQSADEVHGDTKGRTEGLDEGWTEPVSYTHLDVYKRQVKKIENGKPPTYLVSFKGKDIDVMTEAFREFTARCV